MRAGQLGNPVGNHDLLFGNGVEDRQRYAGSAGQVAVAGLSVCRRWRCVDGDWSAPKSEASNAAVAVQRHVMVRIQAKRTALDSISTRRADSVNLEGLEAGYDTKNDTKQRSEAEGFAQVVEKMVDLSGIEPLASSLRTRRSPS